MSTSILKRENEDPEAEPSPKRTKVDEQLIIDVNDIEDSRADQEPANPLPASHALLGLPPRPLDEFMFKVMETDVGISEYVGNNISKIDGIIKQRFTDFLVFEVDQDGQVVHLKSLSRPESPQKDAVTKLTSQAVPQDNSIEDVHASSSKEENAMDISTPIDETPFAEDIKVDANVELLPKADPAVPWPEHFNTNLNRFLSEETVDQVKKLFLEGREPPRISDSGWGTRTLQSEGGPSADTPEVEALELEKQPEIEKVGRGRRGRDRGVRGAKGGRGGRGGGRAGRPQDDRKVVSDPIASKATRTELHQAVRELFNGKLESEADTSSAPGEAGSRIIIRWSKGGGRGRGGRAEGGRGGGGRSNFPPYIHFTMQKTNRDTQDALGHLSRILHVNIKDLSVAGTKDKRGVTIQRVALKRNGKSVEDVWKLANGVPSRRKIEEAVSQRGERGVRIADFKYRKASLELGMLKGNSFLITLRNVQVDSLDTLDKTMNTMKHRGFINYYGMQRFGTASVPTHAIGLALLQSDWQKAVSLILQKRPGEHPDVVQAREAWLNEGNLEKALDLMPRRVVAERCILESYQKQKGDTRNAMGALSTIPRNLRLMYIHAYQSYVWNAIVSERIRTYGSDKPVVGDLVFENKEEAAIIDDLDVGSEVAEKADVDEDADTGIKSKKPWSAPKVKTLGLEDLDKYTIFDVIMPLPGRDVAYPGGALGEKYRQFLHMDGLDPDNWVRKQKDYSLGGSYRSIIHLPKELSWSILRYTDPDVALAQADEDKLLGFDPPAVIDDGKFMALQISIQLGTASYATMALREITKTETGSQFQSNLTHSSEDQKYRGTFDGDAVLVQ